jgi:hypothetical protein
MQESLEETERSRTSKIYTEYGKREKEDKKKTERKQEREIHSTS